MAPPLGELSAKLTEGALPISSGPLRPLQGHLPQRGRLLFQLLKDRQTKMKKLIFFKNTDKVCDETMMILALESSATACSAALTRDGELVAQTYQNSGLTHSRTLLPMVHDMLKNCGEQLEDVDVIAVAAGPGSFTGLRIGVATAKGLAWAGDKDCAPCSTLESMAWPLAHLSGKVIVCAMDARRKQVYNALFLAEGENLKRLTPDRAISLEELGKELENYKNSKIVVGDGAKLCYNTLMEQGIELELAPRPLWMQNAWGVARAAEELAARSALVKGGDLVPMYHRLSQAERERLEREKENK